MRVRPLQLLAVVVRDGKRAVPVDRSDFALKPLFAPFAVQIAPFHGAACVSARVKTLVFV